MVEFLLAQIKVLLTVQFDQHRPINKEKNPAVHKDCVLDEKKRVKNANQIKQITKETEHARSKRSKIPSKVARIRAQFK